MKRRYYMLLLVIMLIVSGCATGDEESRPVDDQGTGENVNESTDGGASDDSPFPVTIEMNGEDITIEEAPENIIPLSLEVAEIVLELVDPSRVTAVTKGVDDPYLSTKSDISDEIPNRVGAAINIDPEEILSYETDLLLLTKMYGQEEDANKILNQLETPTLSFDNMVTVDHFLESALIIGEAIGEKEKAEGLVDDMRSDIVAIQEMIPEDESPSVLILSEVGGDMGPLMMGPTNISYDLVHLAGATPAVDSIDLERSTPAAIEQILKMDPDYIFLLDFFGKGEEGFEDLMNDPGWQTLQAVEDDQIKMVEAKYILNPNFQNVEGLKIMTDFIYNLEDE